MPRTDARDPGLSGGPVRSRALAFALVLLFALWSALGFFRAWSVQSSVAFPPTPEGAPPLAAAVPLWAQGVGLILLIAALLCPSLAAALSAAPGDPGGERVREIRRRWMTPLLALALVTLAGGAGSWLIHLGAPRNSYLWWSRFGFPELIDGMSTVQVLIHDGVRRLSVALALLGLGCLLLGLATALSSATGRPMLAFGLTVAVAVVGHWAVQVTVLDRHLWSYPLALPAVLAAVLWALCLPLWGGTTARVSR
jgi:hypothetical protein